MSQKKYTILIAFLWAFFFLLYADVPSSSPKLLIKIPTRARPLQFFAMLNKCYEKLSGEIPYHFLIVCDEEDLSMNCEEVKNRLALYPHLTLLFGDNKTKVEAYNYGLENYQAGFDILLVMGDEMEPLMNNYDKVLADKMCTHFSDFDGILTFYDGSIDTLLIVGKKYYQRLGYIYHPSYQALWCEKEWVAVAKMLGKEAVFDQKIIYYTSPLYTKLPFDALKVRNETFYCADHALFEKRRACHFEINENLLKEGFDKEWSILICTLEERKEKFSKLYNKLKNQIKAEGLEDKVEILYFLDNREYSVGFKRNALLRQSKGAYVNYIDDDDDIHTNYIKIIYEKLKNRPDCVSLTGMITFNGHSKKFVHSLNYQTYFEQENVYYRPPNHLNPIKRSIASQFLFPNQSYSEDIEWALQIVKSGLLKTEEIILEPYYFYLYIPMKHVSSCSN